MCHLYLVNPPAQAGHTNERDQSGGIGVSRKLKRGEWWRPSLPPLDMLNAAAAAEKAGLTVELVDLLLEGLGGEAALHHLQSALIGATGTIWIGVRLSIPSLPQDLAFANAVKEHFPAARVFCLGGVIMTTYRHWIAQCSVDFLVYGEPEAILPGVFAAADWRQADGIIAIAGYQPDGLDPFDPRTATDYARWIKTKDLGAIERPAWHLVPMERYTWSGKTSDAVGIVQASRGCPIACNMCAYTMLEGGPLRKSDATRVVDEIAYLQETYGITHFRFRDANFSYDRRLLKAILAQLKMRNIKIEAAAELSLEMLDRPTLQSMYDAGILTILTGVETADPDCMVSIGQNIKVNAIIQNKLKWCEEIGIKAYTFFLIGSPEESWTSIKRTVAFAKELGTESTLTLMTPFPGTPLYWRAIKEGLLPKEMAYEKWNSYTATVRTYHLNLTELTRARMWARLETIIPYRLSQARRQGRRELLKAYWHHVPHYAVRQALRTYVWWRADAAPSLRGAFRMRPATQASV
jgi:anaerobic magnesium-protoporphyrin IX monomethyl ester cyclase